MSAESRLESRRRRSGMATTPAARTSLPGLAVAVLMAACGGGGPAPASTPTPVRRPPPVVPAGVDSAVAAHADSLAHESFVEPDVQDRALELQSLGRILVERTDSLWAGLAAAAAREDSGLSDGDAAASDQAVARGGQALVALDEVLRDPSVDEEALRGRTAALLDSAESSLERAFQLNPFDTRTRLWLARVYELQARRLGLAAAHESAVGELEKLSLLTPDQHGVWSMLANNHFELGHWEEAALAYREAWIAYLETRELVPGDAPPLDRRLVFGYVAAEGDMHIRALDAEHALDAFRRGMEYASTPEDSTFMRDQMDWVSWDDSRIASSVARDSLAALAEAGELEEARRGFRALRSRVTAPRAVDETDWRLGIVEYNLGLVEDAAERLRAVVGRTEKDGSGFAMTPAAARYLEDFGTLCINFGRELVRERRDTRAALMYFTQATRFGWSGRPLAHYEAARLLQANLDAALESAGAALREEDSLTPPQRADLYRLLMELHRRAGNFEQARVFRDAYRSITSG